MLPGDLAKDARVVSYFADRRIQYGGVMEKEAIAYASISDTPEGFLKRLTDFDLMNIGKAFTTYLKNNPNNVKGLRNRIQNRLTSAMRFERGEMLTSSSTAMNTLQDSLGDGLQMVIVNRETIPINQDDQVTDFVAKTPDINPILQMR
jgi:hypothetical protein